MGGTWFLEPVVVGAVVVAAAIAVATGLMHRWRLFDVARYALGSAILMAMLGWAHFGIGGDSPVVVLLAFIAGVLSQMALASGRAAEAQGKRRGSVLDAA